MKQVDKEHYEFERYMTKHRWASLWHQVHELIKLHPRNVLEVGPGPGLLKIIARRVGIHVETLDFDEELGPDHVGSVSGIPLPDTSYDAVCAFQVLEHLPYEDAVVAFRELVRVSRKHILLSLPDAQPLWRYTGHVPWLGVREVSVPRPRWGPAPHVFDGQHHWELNKRGYPLAKVLAEYSKFAQLRQTYRVPELAYHRFLLFERHESAPRLTGEI